MKFEAELTTPDCILCAAKTGKEKILRKGLTAKNVGCIVGLDKQDGSGILISRESWKRLEVFMALLSGVKMTISEEKLSAILKKKPNK